METRNLIQFIESHGKKVRGGIGGVLEVQTIYTQRLPNSEKTAVFSQWERIPATMKAAREWLGY